MHTGAWRCGRSRQRKGPGLEWARLTPTAASTDPPASSVACISEIRRISCVYNSKRGKRNRLQYQKKDKGLETRGHCHTYTRFARNMPCSRRECINLHTRLSINIGVTGVPCLSDSPALLLTQLTRGVFLVATVTSPEPMGGRVYQI